MALGKILREARERRQLTLSQVAAGTRMKVQVAEAIEAEDYRKLPAPIYGRGFIRMYASFVGVDPKPLVAEYMAALAGPPEQPPVQQTPPVPGQPRQPKLRTTATPSSAKFRSSPPAPAAAQTTTPAAAPKPETVSAEPAPDEGAEVAVSGQVGEPVSEPPLQEPQPAQESVAGTPVTGRDGAPPKVTLHPAPSTPAPGIRQDDDLFAWGHSAAPGDVPAGTMQTATPVPPEPGEDEPAQPDLAVEAGSQQVAPPVPVTPQPEPAPAAPVQETPAPVAAEPPPQEQVVPPVEGKPAGDLFVTSAPAAPSKTSPGSYPQNQRRFGQRPGSGEPTLSSEREALKWRATMVVVGVVVVAILLISALSKCSAPPKEVKRGPVKERLKMAVEPPAPYVD